jgi:hypothetical protein
LSVTLANGTCTDCANASGAFTLNAVTPGCVWRSDPFDLCSESGCYWTASMVSDRYWVIVLTTPSAGSIMSYLLDVLGDCSLPVVVPRNSQSGECVGSLTARLA